jgi:4-amino-4-deoxy-L-arabinose transferase-like glycosyltransferase
MLVLLAALVLRVGVLSMTAGLPVRIADERQYHKLATSLVEGRGFAFESGPTSLRPPLYPAMVAALWSISDSRSLQLVRAVQAGLGLLTAWLAYLVARRLYNPRVALLTAAVVAFYPALVLANALLLTETLFTFLITGFVLAVVMLLDRPTAGVALAAGLLLGLAALTRSVVWPFPLVLAPLLLWLVPASVPRRAGLVALLLAAYVATIAPWAVRNSRLQRVPVVVDTMGGMNLRMGNYAHTPHDRIWDAVSMGGQKSWVVGIPPRPPDGGEWTEGWKDRWARDEAIRFMLAHPTLTIWRSVIKSADFWALDRDFIAGIQQGLFRPPLWAGIVASAAMLVAFPVVVTLAVLGTFLTPPANWRAHVLLVVLVLFVWGLHAVVFGHPRYRLPLTPVLALYAGAAVAGAAWHKLRDGWRVALWPMTVIAALALSWAVQFAIRDLGHLKRLAGGA